MYREAAGQGRDVHAGLMPAESDRLAQRAAEASPSKHTWAIFIHACCMQASMLR